MELVSVRVWELGAEDWSTEKQVQSRLGVHAEDFRAQHLLPSFSSHPNIPCHFLPSKHPTTVHHAEILSTVNLRGRQGKEGKTMRMSTSHLNFPDGKSKFEFLLCPEDRDTQGSSAAGSFIIFVVPLETPVLNGYWQWILF